MVSLQTVQDWEVLLNEMFPQRVKCPLQMHAEPPGDIPLSQIVQQFAAD